MAIISRFWLKDHLFLVVVVLEKKNELNREKVIYRSSLRYYNDVMMLFSYIDDVIN